MFGITLFKVYQDLWRHKTKCPSAIVWHCLCDPVLAILVQYWLMMDKHMATIYTMLA